MTSHVSPWFIAQICSNWSQNYVVTAWKFLKVDIQIANQNSVNEKSKLKCQIWFWVNRKWIIAALLIWVKYPCLPTTRCLSSPEHKYINRHVWTHTSSKCQLRFRGRLLLNFIYIYCSKKHIPLASFMVNKVTGPTSVSVWK